MSFDSKVKVAVVQATPVLFNKKLTLEKCLGLIDAASQQNPDLIVFPESFIPAYPRGMIFGTSIGSRTDEGRSLWKNISVMLLMCLERKLSLLPGLQKNQGHIYRWELLNGKGKVSIAPSYSFLPQEN